MGTSPDQHYCLRWNNHQANFVEVFDQLLENETFTDVTLAVDDGVFVKCHKMVLAACSSYFKTLFTELPCTHPIVVLKDVKYKEIKAILEYMYTGQVNVAQDHLTALLKVAEVLKVKGLVANETSSSSSSSEATKRNEETISTSTTAAATNQNYESGGAAAGQSSPPHSTSSPYYGYGKSPPGRNHGAKLPLPMWALSQSLPLSGQNPNADSAALQSSFAARHASLFSAHYDNTAEAITSHSRKSKISSNISMMRNHDTPILRTVLGQGHVDSSISQHQPDGHETHYRSHSNDSANNESDGRRSSMDTPSCPPAHSPYATDTSMMEDDEKKGSPQSYGDDAKSGITNYVPAQKPEWKRYKQYTRDDISNAIEAVRRGMSALQAARKFGVPSRTLYDKVKKLGITTSRPFRRSANGSGACFPYGVGGNVNGSIYGTISESENENSSALMENPASLLETAFGESRDGSRDRESMMEITRRTPSPHQQLGLYSQRPMSAEEPSQQLQQQQQEHQQPPPPIEDNENEVEDLSVSRRSDVRVIMSPGISIKEEI